MWLCNPFPVWLCTTLSMWLCTTFPCVAVHSPHLADTWTGLWRAPFILQTFAHHFNFTQGHADISTVYNDFSGPRTALALASAAVICHSKRPSQAMYIWTTVLPKGSQFEFGEAVWGMMTRRYLEPIKELSDKQFGLIVEDTQKFVKKVTAPTASALESVGEDEFDDLFTFW
ncbi:hypothetical protein EDD15DRAFT_2202949 [Pisolithus albus]|nr:hypothetical protein EDD15DRAFT_2202949 [Pisolithus albus]